MHRSPDNVWLHRFAVLTAVATFFLIWVGGLVTSHGVGMAVPDWPTTYGYNMFFFPFSKWVGGIFYEHSHRLVASIVGMLFAILSGWVWVRETSGWTRRTGVIAIVVTLGLVGVRTQPMFVALAGVAVIVIVFSFTRLVRGNGGLRWWAAIAFATVLVQGVLGGLRVTAMKDALGVFHGTLAQMLLALICSIALVTSPWWKRNDDARQANAAGPLRYWFALATVLILTQLILGASMRHQHAGLAIPDFPMAHGDLWPKTDAASVSLYNQQRGEVNALNPITASGIILQMTHRLMALAIVLVIAWLAGATLRRAGLRSVTGKLVIVWSALIALQACLGAATIWTNKAADIATAHVAIGALCLVTSTLLTLLSMRHSSVNVRREDYFLTKEAIHSDARPVQINA